MAKDKKNKNKNPSGTSTPPPLTNTFSAGGKTDDLSSTLSPEQISQLHIEEAIKESQNPSLKLKKLKSPLSFKGCLLNLVIFVVLTIVVVFVVAYFKVDRFNVIVILKDILDKFGISQFFKDLFKRIGNVFRGKGWTLDDAIRMLGLFR